MVNGVASSSTEYSALSRPRAHEMTRRPFMIKVSEEFFSVL